MRARVCECVRVCVCDSVRVRACVRCACVCACTHLAQCRLEQPGQDVRVEIFALQARVARKAVILDHLVDGVAAATDAEQPLRVEDAAAVQLFGAVVHDGLGATHVAAPNRLD